MAVKLFDTLKKEHREVKDSLKKLKKDDSSSEDRLDMISKSLRIHMKGEEKYFYPALYEFEELRELIIEAMDEHKIAKRALKKLTRTDYDEEGFEARAKLLHDLIEHHTNEEENQIFPKSEKVVGEEQLMKMEEDYMDYKERKM